MDRLHPLEVVFWIAMIVAPIAALYIGYASLPAGTEQIPMHFDFHGNVDSYGDPKDMLWLGWLMGGLNLMMGASRLFNPTLYRKGLVHGVTPRGAVWTYRLCAILLTVITVIIAAVIY